LAQGHQNISKMVAGPGAPRVNDRRNRRNGAGGGQNELEKKPFRLESGQCLKNVLPAKKQRTHRERKVVRGIVLI